MNEYSNLPPAHLQPSLKRPEALPDWFKLHNYKNVIKLDAAGWAAQLQARLIYLCDLSLENYQKNKKIQLIQQKGLVEPESFLFLKRHKERHNGIFEVEIDHLMAHQIYRSIIFESEEYVDIVESKLLSDCLDFSTNEFCVTVDLSVSDALLEKRFKLMLAEKRVDNKVTVIKGKPNFNNWIAAGVLPYLDLFYYFQASNIKFTWLDYSRSIFSDLSDKYGDSENIHHTTVDNAKKFLTIKNYSHLISSV
jgi:hypothetical protein